MENFIKKNKIQTKIVKLQFSYDFLISLNDIVKLSDMKIDQKYYRRILNENNADKKIYTKKLNKLDENISKKEKKIKSKLSIEQELILSPSDFIRSSSSIVFITFSNSKSTLEILSQFKKVN